MGRASGFGFRAPRRVKPLVKLGNPVARLEASPFKARPQPEFPRAAHSRTNWEEIAGIHVGSSQIVNLVLFL
jgi:hypothetical protein